MNTVVEMPIGCEFRGEYGPGHLLRREGNADLVLAGDAGLFDGKTDEREGGGGAGYGSRLPRGRGSRTTIGSNWLDRHPPTSANTWRPTRPSASSVAPNNKRHPGGRHDTPPGTRWR